MKLPFVRPLIIAAVLVCHVGPASAQGPVPPPAVPPADIIAQEAANLRFKATLDRRYDALRARHSAWTQRAIAFNRDRAGRNFQERSPEARAAAAESAWLSQERTDYALDVARFVHDLEQLRIDRAAKIRAMATLARALPNWEQGEVERVQSIMRRLQLDGVQDVTLLEMLNTWVQIEARDGDATLAAAAAAGAGPAGLRNTDPQSFEDCTIYAVASATGRPYSVVAALAGEIVRDNAARGDGDRDDPESVIKNHGLDGDEVILLTEAFGEAELVPSGAFVRTLQEGRPVLLSVAPITKNEENILKEGNHAVVLSRTFQHDGQTWFEMIDSNLPAGQRRYLTQPELLIVLRENGISYRPEDGRTVPLLRP